MTSRTHAMQSIGKPESKRGNAHEFNQSESDINRA